MMSTISPFLGPNFVNSDRILLMPKIIFSDFDGTLTLENRAVTPELFLILEEVKRHEAELVIVSGRSVSWGHFFLTHFPQINTVIMEGGGVILHRDPKMGIREEFLVSDSDLMHLETLTEKLLEHFPTTPLSVDSFGRKTDRAIEFEQMHDQHINEVIEFFKRHNVNYSKSNVHINFWVGEISKYIGVSKYLESKNGLVQMDDCLFFGDAPNDQSMFQFFPNSIGVSNIESCLHRLEHKPKVVLKGEENIGPRGVLNYLKNL